MTTNPPTEPRETPRDPRRPSKLQEELMDNLMGKKDKVVYPHREIVSKCQLLNKGGLWTYKQC